MLEYEAAKNSMHMDVLIVLPDTKSISTIRDHTAVELPLLNPQI